MKPIEIDILGISEHHWPESGCINHDAATYFSGDIKRKNRNLLSKTHFSSYTREDYTHGNFHRMHLEELLEIRSIFY